ncbi:MAG: hypothetical protein WCK39_00360 [Methanomassiliicoccales archaeon]
MVGNVESLLQRINDIGIVQRMLSWKQVRSLGGLAAQEFGELRARADAADRRAADVEQRLRLQEDTIRRSGEDVLQARTDAQRISLQMENVSAALRQTEQSLAAAKAKAEADYLEIRRLNADMITAQGNEERARTQAGDAAKKAYEMSASLEAEKIERMREVAELHLRLSHLQQEAESLSSELNASKALLAAEDAVREDRLVKYQEGVAQLNALKQTQDSALREMKETAVREAEQRLHAMKETWARHEQNVEAHLKAVCRVLDLDYVDREKVPFNGKPDNTVTVCEQFVIFDAKSPEGEDLQNFPTYVKDQAEKAKKYLADGVMREIFLVVPNNTLPSLNETTYSFTDHRVFVISLDSLEPILKTLRKIDEYHFAEGMSPEDREDICRVLGKFNHMLKRRVQIDAWYSSKAIEVIRECESLPEEVSERVSALEKEEKLNPGTEQRRKAIPLKTLEKDAKRMVADGGVLEIDMEAGREVELLPLQKKTP